MDLYPKDYVLTHTPLIGVMGLSEAAPSPLPDNPQPSPSYTRLELEHISHEIKCKILTALSSHFNRSNEDEKQIACKIISLEKVCFINMIATLFKLLNDCIESCISF